MTIPPRIISAINRLNQELDLTEDEVRQGLELARSKLNRFPEDPLTIALFASAPQNLVKLS
jgi:hypothetical protein